MSIESVTQLLTGIALFLFGMSLMGAGLKRVAGSKLEVILYKLTGSPFKGVLFGAGITAVIQSSSATSVMVVGFVNSGLMKVRQAIYIVLGAIFGTSITGWVICLSQMDAGSGWLALFSTDTLTCVAALVGIFFLMFSKNRFKNHLGEILLGFAVLMFGMSVMSGAVEPLKKSETFIGILTKFSNPLIGICVGIAFTCILQSASAAVGILQALAGTGAITFDIALPLVMGISIGAAVPVLLSAVGASANGKRTSYAYLISNVLGVIVGASLFYGIHALVRFSFMGLVMDTVSVALLNTVYRLVVVLLLAPLARQIERISVWMAPDTKREAKDSSELLPLEERFLSHPALAVEQSRNAINDMAMKARDNLLSACGLLRNYSDSGYEHIRKQEALVDGYEDRLGTYLLKVNTHELDADQNASVGKFLHTITDFERISDHALNLAESAKELHDKNTAFSPAATQELSVLGSAVEEIVNISISAFLTGDLKLAARVEPLEEVIDNLCGEIKLHHVNRLQSKSCTFASGFAFNDILNSYERIADHCSNLAVAMIAIESDSFDTHEYLNSVKKLKDETFSAYLQEYSWRYSLSEAEPVQ